MKRLRERFEVSREIIKGDKSQIKINMKLNVLCFLLSILLFSQVQCVYITLKPWEKKCFIDDVPAGIVNPLSSHFRWSLPLTKFLRISLRSKVNPSYIRQPPTRNCRFSCRTKRWLHKSSVHQHKRSSKAYHYLV